MAHEWGPLTPLQELLAREDLVADGDKDRKQSDVALARLLNGEEFGGAIHTASLAELDLALAHDALAVERKPLCFLTLLSAKSAKLDAWAAREGVDEKAAQRHAAARLATQLAQFFSQVAVSVAAKELKRVSQLAVQYVAIVVDLHQAIKAVYPLQSFLRRFHGHGHTAVTAIHAQFLYLCLQAKCYSAATEILNQPLFEVHAHSNVSAVDFLSYAYYGGVLYLGQKQYQQAIDLFLSVVTAPAIALSAFVVDAYKKLVLASLILHGDTPTLPKYTPFVVTRHLEMHCGPYQEIARAFTGDSNNNVHKMASVVQHHAAAFAKDGNTGLVKQVADALQQRKLLQLPRTYVTLALREMAAMAFGGGSGSDGRDDASMGEDEASETIAIIEKRLLQLIARGDMRAVVDQHKQMVTFVLDQADDADDAAQHQIMTTLQHEMDKMLHVATQLRAMDTDVVTSAKFQHRAQKDKDRRTRGAMQSQDDARGALLGQLSGGGNGGNNGGARGYDAMMD